MQRAELEAFRQRARSLRRRAEIDAVMVTILDTFDRAGIESLVLKGPALAQLLYTADEHRGYTDVDLLVSPAELANARRILADLGCVPTDAARGVHEMAGNIHAERWMQLRDEAFVMVDLHWRLSGSDAPPEVAWAALAPHKTSIEVNGRNVAVLDRTALALHLATHAANHGPSGLKAMADLTRGIERWPPDVWRSAARLAAELDATQALATGLRLVPEGAALAHSLGLPSTDAETWALLHRPARPRGMFHLEAFVRARTLRERADVLRRSLLPSPTWIAWENRALPGGRARRLLRGYAVHLLRAPSWAARAWRFRRQARRAAR